MPADHADAEDRRTISLLLLESLELLDDIVRFLGRRHGLTRDDEADLASEVKLKLLDDDHAILRSFRHSSSLKTFLVGVAHHTLLDQLQQRWGKWRPSAAARRLGPAAVELERHVHHDQRTVDEAIEILARGGAATRDDLRRIHRLLPPRERRLRLGDDSLDEFPAPGADAAAVIKCTEREAAARRTERVLEEELAKLEPRDALLLRLAFSDGFTVTQIAKTWGEDRRPLYRRVETLLRALRRRLEAAGVDAAMVRDVLAVCDTELHLASLRGGPSGEAP